MTPDDHVLYTPPPPMVPRQTRAQLFATLHAILTTANPHFNPHHATAAIDAAEQLFAHLEVGVSEVARTGAIATAWDGVIAELEAGIAGHRGYGPAHRVRAIGLLLSVMEEGL